MSYGPSPWQQTHWDARAATNFVAGGAGSGLVVFATVEAAARGAQPIPALLLAGLALIGLGLACVWLEIGRPWRALNVFINLRRSWMSREALSAAALFGAGGAALLGIGGFAWVAAALALVFVYCQARMLRAARGIPAWRESVLTPFMVVTGLAEGAGLLVLALPLVALRAPATALAFGTLVLVRMFCWLAYRRRFARVLAPAAAATLERAGRALALAGTLVPLAAVALAVAGALPEFAAAALLAVAGLLAASAGAHVKVVLITRAGFNQGFALAHLPVRGERS
ncbi:MAG TPA: DmsC/YnfH family molybdoenzyme membrane anchor subunit [Casimicrobiaceae bacterium]